MISRIWHGWTTPGNADAYEKLLKEEIFTGIHNQHIQGLMNILLLRRDIAIMRKRLSSSPLCFLTR
jgi:hypothetical protein